VLSQASINRLVRDPYHAGGMRVKSHESAHFARWKRPQERPTSPSTVDVTQLFELGTEHAASAAPPVAAPPAAEGAQSPTSPAFVTEPTAAESAAPEGPSPTAEGAAAEEEVPTPDVVAKDGDPGGAMPQHVDTAARTEQPPEATGEKVSKEHTTATASAADAPGLASTSSPNAAAPVPRSSKTVGSAATLAAAAATVYHS